MTTKYVTLDSREPSALAVTSRGLHESVVIRYRGEELASIDRHALESGYDVPLPIGQALRVQRVSPVGIPELALTYAGKALPRTAWDHRAHLVPAVLSVLSMAVITVWLIVNHGRSPQAGSASTAVVVLGVCLAAR